MKIKLSNDKNTKQVTSFTFHAPSARRVSLAGEFNNWNPEDMPMYKASDGVWYLSVSLTPGRHEYRFIADGTWQDDPGAQEKTANAFGTANCVKIVSAETNGALAQRKGTRLPNKE